MLFRKGITVSITFDRKTSKINTRWYPTTFAGTGRGEGVRGHVLNLPPTISANIMGGEKRNAAVG